MRGIFIEDLKKMILKHFEPYQTRIYLFGSFSRNQAKTSSDVDVAILPLEEIPNQVFVDLRNKIEESTIPYVVDIIDMSKIDNTLKSQIEKDGIVWKK